MRRAAAARGFTLTELVMVIVIIGILAVIVAPRFMSSQPFETRGFYDEAQAVVRYAQKVAIAQRRTIFVCVAANEIAAISNNDCTSPTYLAHPVGGGQLRAASRELPQPFDCPLTTTPKRPPARLPFSTTPPRRPISEYCPSVSS